MRKDLIIAGSVLLLGSLCFLGGWYVGQKKDPAVIEVVKEIQGPTEYRTRVEYVYSQENFDKLYSCYRSPILIQTTVNKNVLHIEAKDECKQSYSDVTLAVTDTPNWKLRLTVAGVAGAVVLAGGVYAGWKIRGAL